MSRHSQIDALVEALAALHLDHAAEIAARVIAAPDSSEQLSSVVDFSGFFAPQLAARLDDASVIRLLDSDVIDRQAFAPVVWARLADQLCNETSSGRPLLSLCCTEAVLVTALRTLIVDDIRIERLLRSARAEILCELLSEEHVSLEPELLDFITAFETQCRRNPWIWGADTREALVLHDLTSTLLPSQQEAVRALFPETSAEVGFSPGAVRHQYEQHPYPAWQDLPALAVDSLSDRLLLSGRFVDPRLVAPVVHRPAVLIAGCGTGQHALRFARSTECALVVGVDVSAASLRFARDQARRHGVPGCYFCQADLAALPFADQSFDVIECVGVLHHLDNPDTYLGHLCRLLAPGGRICLGVYSASARAAVEAARSLMSESDADLASRRALLADLQPDDPAAAVTASVDFYPQEGFVDLLFPARETTYSLDELRTLIDSAGLSAVAVEYPHPAMARIARGLTAKGSDPLQVANSIEQAVPEAFSSMYIVWLESTAEIGVLRE